MHLVLRFYQIPCLDVFLKSVSNCKNWYFLVGLSFDFAPRFSFLWADFSLESVETLFVSLRDFQARIT